MQKCLKKYNLKNYYYSKFFTTDGKIKTNDLNAKNKQFSVNAFFTDENPQNTKTQSSHLSFDSNNYDKKENDDETVQFIEKIIDNIEKKKNDDPNPFKAKENPYNTNKVNISRSAYRQSNNHDENIDEMLNHKNSNYYPNNNTYNKNFNSNNTVPGISNATMKRQRISFIREGMILCFYLKKVKSEFTLVNSSCGFWEKRRIYFHRIKGIY